MKQGKHSIAKNIADNLREPLDGAEDSTTRDRAERKGIKAGSVGSQKFYDVRASGNSENVIHGGPHGSFKVGCGCTGRCPNATVDRSAKRSAALTEHGQRI